jgi:hypothetical protein
VKTLTQDLASQVKRDFPDVYKSVPFIMPLRLALAFDTVVADALRARGLGQQQKQNEK